jgi:hypothetical protein
LNLLQREKLKKDKVSGKVATECTPALAVEEITEGNAAQYSSDPFYSSTTNSEDKDDIHKCDDLRPTVSVSSINNGNGNYTFEVSVGNGTHPIASDKFSGKLTVSIDGNVIADGARDITGPGIYQFTYVSSLAETATLTVTVSDSALYEAQDAIDVPFELPVIVPTTYLPTRNVVALDRPRVAVAMAT